MEKTNYFKSPVIASSGLMGIVGEGYPYHKIFKVLFPFLFSFKWITFQAKTITAFIRKGNMELSKIDGITPVEFMPKCIYANIWKGYGVNNVSLSNPGIATVLAKGKLQQMTGELHLSIMLVSKVRKERLIEATHIVNELRKELKNFKASKIFLHWNVSCPNTDHDGEVAFRESFEQEYNILSKLDLDIILKVGWNFPINLILEMQERKMIYAVDAINSIPFNDLPVTIKGKYFKFSKESHRYISPLDKYQELFLVKGRGGVSGNPIRQFALRWIKDARDKGVTLPIIGGGGILWPKHVNQFKKAGATAISPGSVAFLRPFNLFLITLRARRIFKEH